MPFIAETGGINAMIVDATALPEQVTDDVVGSVFRSAGQRCSALRLLCVQEHVADPIFTMVEGAARELVLGDPHDPATHVGPVIDRESKDAARCVDRASTRGRCAIAGTATTRCRRRLVRAADHHRADTAPPS